jgi:U3 small nucleolar RNA-associated protein 22
MKKDRGIRVPFPTPPPPEDALYKYKFRKPVQIKLVGSYGLKGAARSSQGFTIDVAVTMPDVHPCQNSLIPGTVPN